MTFPLLDHISNDLSKFSQCSFRYSVVFRSFHYKSTFFYFFNNIRRPLSYLRIQWCIIRFSWDRSLEKGRKKEKEEKEKWEEQKAFEWSEGACFTAFTKSRLLEGVEYLRRTGWNLIKKIHRWRSTTGMQELFCYYILLCLLFFLEKKKKKRRKRKEIVRNVIQSRVVHHLDDEELVLQLFEIRIKFQEISRWWFIHWNLGIQHMEKWRI